MTINNTYQKLYKQLIILAMIWAYVMVFIVRENFHAHHHAEHAQEHCSAEVENDPCHLKIYHHDTQNGCDHDAHFIPQDEDCDLCTNFLTNSQQPIELLVWEEYEVNEYYHTVGHYQDVYIDCFVGLQKSRGPPFLLFV